MGGLGAAGEKGRCACKCGSHPGCCCRAGKQEPPCPGRCPEISTAEGGGGRREGGIRWRGVGGAVVVGSGGEMRGSPSCHVPGVRGTGTLWSSGCPAAPARPRAALPGPGVSAAPGIPARARCRPEGASGVTCRRRRPLPPAEAEGSE